MASNSAIFSSRGILSFLLIALASSRRLMRTLKNLIKLDRDSTCAPTLVSRVVISLVVCSAPSSSITYLISSLLVFGVILG